MTTVFYCMVATVQVVDITLSINCFATFNGLNMKYVVYIPRQRSHDLWDFKMAPPLFGVTSLQKTYCLRFLNSSRSISGTVEILLFMSRFSTRFVTCGIAWWYSILWKSKTSKCSKKKRKIVITFDKTAIFGYNSNTKRRWSSGKLPHL